MTQPLNIIAILGSDLAIGRRGDQPFHISDDFRRFKALTSGHPVIMGRRTFEALPKGALPLIPRGPPPMWRPSPRSKPP